MQSKNRRAFIGALAATAILITHPTMVAAQGSNVPLRIIVPASAGSGQDVMVRSAQNAMSKTLGRPVIVENVPGSGGIIGTQQLVKAPPDGNTIAFVSNNHAVNPAVYKKMPYDSLKDITPITIVGETPFLLVVNPKRLPANNAKEVVALIKAKPDHYNFGSSGNGTILHLAAEMFVDEAGLKARHIPYKGTGQMITDLIGGQVDFGVLAVPAVQAHLKAGTLRAVAATGSTRVPSLANIPTLQEQGINVDGRRLARRDRAGQALYGRCEAPERGHCRRVDLARGEEGDGRTGEHHQSHHARSRRGDLQPRAGTLWGRGPQGRRDVGLTHDLPTAWLCLYPQSER